MKTRVIVAVVVMIHCVAVGTLLMQGCRTSGGQSMAPERTDISNTPVDVEPMSPPVDVVETPVMTEVEPVIPQIETTSYVVRKGDTLGAIAKHYGVRIGDIMALNGLDNANKLRVGQKLELPGIHDVTSAPPVAHSKPKASKKKAETKETVATTDGDGTYTIQKGDYLAKIAKKFGVSVQALKEANSMSSDKITAGKKLKIPGSTATEAPITIDVPAGTFVDGGAAPAPTPDVTNGIIQAPDAIDTSDLDGSTAAPPAPDSSATTDASVSQAPTVTTPAPIISPSDYKTHPVAAGEDLSTIAIQWGVSEDAIRSLNGLTSDTLTVGQVLKIPAP